MHLNLVLEKKEQIILKKFIAAEEIRQQRLMMREQLRKQRESPRQAKQLVFDKIAALEQELKQEWRKKENGRLIGIKSKEIEKLQEKQLIQKKVRIQTEKQHGKIQRTERPEGPKAPTLPYLKDAKTKLIQEADDEAPEPDESVELKTVGRPSMLLYFPGGNAKASPSNRSSPRKLR